MTLVSWEYSAAAFTEANTAKAFAFAKTFHDHLVSVFEKSALLAGW